MAISRDGQVLAYISAESSRRPRLVVRRLDESASRPLEGTEDAAHPIFSPDGQWLAYIRGNELFRVPVAGGRPQSLGTAPGTFNGMSWSRSGHIVVSGNVAMYQLPETGGAPREWARSDNASGELYQDTPVVDDDAGVVLYSSWQGSGPTTAKIAIALLETGETTVLDLLGITPLGVVDGVVVYVTSTGIIMGAPIDLSKRRLLGPPVQLVLDVATNASTGIARAALAADGTLLYERGSPTSQVVLAGAGGVRSILLSETQEYAFPRLSPDGATLAITVGDGGRRDVWLYDMVSRTPTRLTTSAGTNERPEWTPSGDRVLYRTDESSRSAIWWRPSDLSTPPTPLVGGERVDIFEAVVSPDGQHVVYQLDTLGADLYARRLTGDSTPIPISVKSGAIETMPRISPDGRWIAFVTDESGRDEVVVQPFPGPGGRYQVSGAGGTQPVWSRDGQRLFYRDGVHFMAAIVRTEPTFAVVSRDSLFVDEYVLATNPHANYDVLPDGSGFIVMKTVNDVEMVVVVGWASVMRRMMDAAVRR